MNCPPSVLVKFVAYSLCRDDLEGSEYIAGYLETVEMLFSSSEKNVTSGLSEENKRMIR
jgi:hypothetical protein